MRLSNSAGISGTADDVDFHWPLLVPLPAPPLGTCGAQRLVRLGDLDATAEAVGCEEIQEADGRQWTPRPCARRAAAAARSVSTYCAASTCCRRCAPRSSVAAALLEDVPLTAPKGYGGTTGTVGRACCSTGCRRVGCSSIQVRLLTMVRQQRSPPSAPAWFRLSCARARWWTLRETTRCHARPRLHPRCPACEPWSGGDLPLHLGDQSGRQGGGEAVRPGAAGGAARWTSG